ncbi:MAG: rhodoquinone biosynthesis methyltransferase RquA [Burkholderiaceae bacterium]|nr:rhodoquinone biosynthesis methyltransferase RquA [Burkholderiaceae bacterium]
MGTSNITRPSATGGRRRSGISSAGSLLSRRVPSVHVSPPLAAAVQVTGADDAVALRAPPVPRYLEQVYWWAYVHPKAVHLFERDWLVNAILFGNYGRLRDAALADLGGTVRGRTLQVACAYGNLTARLQQRLASDASLDVVDILPIQLRNLARKLPDGRRLRLLHGDSSALTCHDASYDQVLLFFLLHEQPEHVRRATLAQALRVVKPGGKVVIVDYHQPSRWHPMRWLMRLVFAKLEPYAMDLWHHEIAEFLPSQVQPAVLSKRTYFGGLYQKLVLVR